MTTVGRLPLKSVKEDFWTTSRLGDSMIASCYDAQTFITRLVEIKCFCFILIIAYRDRETDRGPNKNKAGYTATSCGRVGRGGNARFHTFQLDHWTDGLTDGRTKPLIELRIRN